MASNIDVSVPTPVRATTKSVRDNFIAAKEEIEALQNNESTINQDILDEKNRNDAQDTRLDQIEEDLQNVDVGPVTTSMVETEVDSGLREINLTNQKEVNNYIWENIEALEGYDDSTLRQELQDETEARVEADKELQDQIDALIEASKPEPERFPIFSADEPTEYPGDPDPIPLEEGDQWYKVEDPDFDYDSPNPEGLELYLWDTEEDSWVLWEPEIEIDGVVISPNPPENYKEGTLWFDSTEDTMQLFLWHEESDAWLPVAPPTTLEGRVTTGEALQAEILSRVEAGETKQVQIEATVDNKLGKDERNTVTDSFRILCDGKTFISANDNELGLYNLRTPTSGPHAANMSYVDGEIDRKIAAIEFPEPDVDKEYVDQKDTELMSGISGNAMAINAKADKTYVDQQDDALDTRITSGEQLQNQILEDVRQNKNDIGSINILSQQNYGRSVKNEQDIAELQNNSQEEAIQPLLWTFAGTSTDAEDLNDGEFTFRYEGDQGSTGFFKIYTAIRDASNQRIASQTNFEHNMLDHVIMSIQGSDGGNRIHMKSKTFFFNVGSGDGMYHRFEARYWRVATSCTTGEKYVLNIPGLLPTYGKPSDIGAFTLPDEPTSEEIPPEAES